MPKGIELVSHDATTSKSEVMYASIDQFKGLERKVAIVVELDEELSAKPEQRDALLYVAFSRPRHHLMLMGAPAVLRSIKHVTPKV
jgi:DNA helicase IV